MSCFRSLADIRARHYSYECKATTQERPYNSRPSRTQQLLNPKLTPKLNSDNPNDLLRKKGVADEQLAKAEIERGRPQSRASPSPGAMPSESRKRSRSISTSSSGSVSTISTHRSVSPKRARRRGDDPYFTSQRETPEYQSRAAKRRHSSSSKSKSRSSRSISSADDADRSGQRRSSGANQRRRHRLSSPERRGRPDLHRGASRRTKSRSLSLDRSRIAKERKSLTPASPNHSKGDRDYQVRESHRFSERPAHRSDRGENRRLDGGQPPRKERSVSPFSKRLALTQAMNRG